MYVIMMGKKAQNGVRKISLVELMRKSSKNIKWKIHKCAASALVAFVLVRATACRRVVLQLLCKLSHSMHESSTYTHTEWERKSEWAGIFISFSVLFCSDVLYESSPVASNQTATAHKCQAPTLDYIYLRAELSWTHTRTWTTMRCTCTFTRPTNGFGKGLCSVFVSMYCIHSVRSSHLTWCCFSLNGRVSREMFAHKEISRCHTVCVK